MAVVPPLGNTITEVVADSPSQWSFTRRSHLGLTGIEIAGLARWLESTNFPTAELRSARDPTGHSRTASRPQASQVMLRLGVNIDHVATLREARYRGRLGGEPDPVAAALVCESAGAQGITAHLREDRRHIQDRDVRALRDAIRTRLNLEMANTPEILAFALDLRPDIVCLVPEQPAGDHHRGRTRRGRATPRR